MKDETKKTFSKVGGSLLIMILITTGIQILFMITMGILFPQFATSGWMVWGGIAVSYYMIAFPIFRAIMKKLPGDIAGEKAKVSGKQFLVFFVVIMGATYIFNFVGIGVNTLISLIKGGVVMNPLQVVADSSSIIGTLVCGCILSPIIEEFTFRKIVLGKIRKYGDKTAIWVSALLFGLYHANLSQFFYAVAIGVILAYITLRTNDIKPAIFLHMLCNTFGMILIPALTGVYSATGELSTIGSTIAGLFMIVMMIAGFTIVIRSRKRLVFEKGLRESDPSITRRKIYVNAGMLLFIVFIAFNMLAVILTSA